MVTDFTNFTLVRLVGGRSVDRDCKGKCKRQLETEHQILAWLISAPSTCTISFSLNFDGASNRPIQIEGWLKQALMRDGLTNMNKP